ncbi:MAG: TIGR04282 family arsenosugar biosynthesis glycosyltransferase [Verrucomicrobiales bacterium]
MIFVKFPEPGKVKTRLAKSVGDEAAADIYRKLVARVLERVVAAEPIEGNDGQWKVWILFDPPEREGEIRAWLDPMLGRGFDGYFPQVEGDLGARLGAAFARGFETGFGRIAAIGTDCIEFAEAEIRECWSLLEESDVVFGPAEDGGYYLIGMKREHPELFAEIPWSSRQTLEATLTAAAGAGLAVATLPTMSDVDEIEQWEALCASDPQSLNG